MKNQIDPVLRWAGGKRWLSKVILDHIPDNFENYFELFLGGASVYLSLLNHEKIKHNVYLSDLNPNLINFYKTVRYYNKEIIEDLARHLNDQDYYYEERATDYSSKIQAASKFLYLNRTSFNGIYRENLKGQYNVPYGFKTYKELFDLDKITNFSKALNKSKIYSKDFSYFENKISEGDLVFLDPPYTVAHNNNGFVKYNQKIFSWDDQIRLANFTNKITEIGAYFVMTNADHDSIRGLYESKAKIETLDRISLIGGKKARRGRFSELLIKNF